MSLSVARPIVADPGGLSGVTDPGRIAWIIFVARLPVSGGLLAGGAIWVFGWKFGGGGGEPAPAPSAGGCQLGGGGGCGGPVGSPGGRCPPPPWYNGCGGADGAPGYGRGVPDAGGRDP